MATCKLNFCWYVGKSSEGLLSWFSPQTSPQNSHSAQREPQRSPDSRRPSAPVERLVSLQARFLGRLKGVEFKQIRGLLFDSCRGSPEVGRPGPRGGSTIIRNPGSFHLSVVAILSTWLPPQAPSRLQHGHWSTRHHARLPGSRH